MNDYIHWVSIWLGFKLITSVFQMSITWQITNLEPDYLFLLQPDYLFTACLHPWIVHAIKIALLKQFMHESRNIT